MQGPDTNLKPFALLVFILAAGVLSGSAALCAGEENPPDISTRRHYRAEPVVVFYSRTGTTRTIARALAEQLSCEIVEVRSTKKRHGFWTITCVMDQLLNRDDTIAPAAWGFTNHDPMIIASPIWLHHLASPMQTFLKRTDLKGKHAYLIMTHQGNFNGIDEENGIQCLESRGIMLKKAYNVFTKGLTEEQLMHRVRLTLLDIEAKIKECP